MGQGRLWRKCCLFLALSVGAGAAGCGEARETKQEIVQREIKETEAAGDQLQEKGADLCEELAESCREVYEQARKEKNVKSLETVRKIKECLERDGFAVIDQDNQFNMGNPGLVKEFCERAKEQGQEAKLSLIMVLNTGGFVEFDLRAENGQMEASAKSLRWEEDRLITIDTDTYPVHRWDYREDGYFFFDKHYMEGFAGPYDHVAVRVGPLDDTCRELNRQYILPVGYDVNNLFITDWKEGEWEKLDFYDLYDRLRPTVFPDMDPYAKEGEISLIPRQEFEQVISSYFSVSSRELPEYVRYLSEQQAYEYRPRAASDKGQGNQVYPEVVEYKKQEDGTICLTVQVVWPGRHQEATFRHRTVIRPMAEKGFQYVSNQVMDRGEKGEPEWYQKRMTEEEWNSYYK